MFQKYTSVSLVILSVFALLLITDTEAYSGGVTPVKKVEVEFTLAPGDKMDVALMKDGTQVGSKVVSQAGRSHEQIPADVSMKIVLTQDVNRKARNACIAASNTNIRVAEGPCTSKYPVKWAKSEHTVPSALNYGEKCRMIYFDYGTYGCFE